MKSSFKKYYGYKDSNEPNLYLLPIIANTFFFYPTLIYLDNIYIYKANSSW